MADQLTRYLGTGPLNGGLVVEGLEAVSNADGHRWIAGRELAHAEATGARWMIGRIVAQQQDGLRAIGGVAGGWERDWKEIG